MYDQSVIVMLFVCSCLQCADLGERGEKKKSQKKATMMLCKYFVHCQFGSMIEGFGLLGVGVQGKGVLPLPFQPREFVCLLVLLGLLAYIGMMESF